MHAERSIRGSTSRNNGMFRATSLSGYFGPIADCRRMENDAVAYGHVRTNLCGQSGIGVHDGIVLNIRVLPHLDPLIVAAEHRAKPHACIFQEPDAPDESGVGRHPELFRSRKFRPCIVERVDWHVRFPHWTKKESARVNQRLQASFHGAGKKRTEHATQGRKRASLDSRTESQPGASSVRDPSSPRITSPSRSGHRLSRRRNLSSINSIHDASLTRESPWPSVPRVEETAIFSILTPQPSTLFSPRDPRTTLWIRRDAIENM